MFICYGSLTIQWFFHVFEWLFRANAGLICMVDELIVRYSLGSRVRTSLDGVKC